MNKLLNNITTRFITGCNIFIYCFLLFSCNNITTLTPSRKNIIESVYASGKIIAENEHSIFAMSNGSVINKLVKDGDTVHKGQILFEINNITSTSGLKISEDKIKLLQQFSSSEALPDKYYIFSDCEGIVYQTTKEKGEAVRMNEPVALIGDASKRIIRMAVDQQDIDKIKPGEQVLLKTDVTGDTIYKAAVTKIYSVMNETSQTFRVDAAFISAFSNAFIHNPVEANIIISEKQNALVLPRNAMDGSDSLWTEQNRGKQKIKVRTGISSVDYIEILDGINEKTNVIIPPEK